MQRSSNHRIAFRADRELRQSCRPAANGSHVLFLIIAIIIMMATLSACGGGSSNNPQNSATLSGNWQFTVFENPASTTTNPPEYPPGQLYGLQGGFLLQTNGSVTGQAVYSVANFNQNNAPQVCNAGSATLTATTLSGNTVKLTYVAGSQTFDLTGMLSNGTMSGTYTATQGTGSDGATVCGIGTSQSGPQQWTAVFVPPLAGTITGSFHSQPGTSLANQDFAVSGVLTQGENIGASNATVTGTLSFIDPTTELSVYPCFSVASVNGQISGNSVILQIIATNGANIGQIGEPAGSPTGVNPVTFDSAQGGYILHGVGPSYIVATSACPGNLGSPTTAGDSGDICLALNSTTACQQPITLTPAVITFPAQTLASAAMTQTITLANNSSSALSGLMLSFANDGSNSFGGQSDFNGLPSFAETDACGANGAPSLGQAFSLTPGQSCSITVTFSPQESCPWLPFGAPPSITGAAPEWCPLPQSAKVTVTSPSTADVDNAFAVPITGTGVSAIQPSTPELDFGAEEQFNPPEASLPQLLSFTNVSTYPVQILGRSSCLNPPKGPKTLPHPLLDSSPVAGLQVVANGSSVLVPIAANGDTINYNCDSDSGTSSPNFQISQDTCTGTLLASQASCSLEVGYVPQPNTNVNSGLDYFLELNTVQCSSNVTTDCEIDSGRFPVELKANAPSPLRMSPAAGLDFGNQATGKTSAPMTITLLNDPNLTYPQCTTQDCSTVTFVGKILVSGSYSESDDCPATLAQGSSCAVTVTFKPGGVGLNTGLITINYSQVSSSGVVTLANPQFIYLRGTGQ